MRIIRAFLFAFLFLTATTWTTEAQAAAQPIVVIAPFNLTGPDAVLDAACYQGAELAVEKLNLAGGLLGRPIRLIKVDTASDDSSTANKVEGALESHPNTVAGIGFTDSTYALDAGRVFQKAGLPFITPGATAPDLPRRVGKDLFLAAYGDDDRGVETPVWTSTPQSP